MKVILYRLIDVLFKLVSAIALVIILAQFNTSMDWAYENSIPLLVMPQTLLALIIGWVRHRIGKTYDVQKYLSEKKHKKAMLRVQQHQAAMQDRLSDKCEKINIDPLINAIRGELNSRRTHVTPNNFERIYAIINKYREQNNLKEVNALYELIIGTESIDLNSKINKYLTNFDSRR